MDLGLDRACESRLCSLVTDRAPENLLPSIALLLKEAGAPERTSPVDTETLARQPVFVGDRWKDSIGEFLRWSGTTLAPAGEGSVYELVLGHGRVGAQAIYRAFRDYLIGRGGSLETARSRLEALRVIPSMAAHWLRLIDWDLDDAERLEPADFGAHAQAVVRLPVELSERLKNVVAKDPGIASSADFVEKVVEEKVEERESDNKPPRPRSGNGPSGYFTMGRAISDLWKNVTPDEDPGPPGPRRTPKQEV
jgi:hypothetical protein